MEEVRHQCLIYGGSPSEKLSTLAAVLQQKLEDGYRCLYLNSAPMVAGIRSRLAAMGIDVAEEVAKARLVLSSEPTKTKGRGFDVDWMLEKLEEGLDQAIKDGYIGLWATGDMTWEFGSRKNFAKLMEYEWRLEELVRKRPGLCGICQYHQDTLPSEATRRGLMTHRSLFINETLSRVNPHFAPLALLNGEMPTLDEMDAEIAALCQAQSALVDSVA